MAWQWISRRLARVSHCGQTQHSQCMPNERRLLGFHLNFHLATEGSRTSATLWASGGQVRWAQAVPCGICDKGQRLGNNNKTTFFFMRSSPCRRFCRAVFFIFISWNIWFGSSLPSQGRQECSFLQRSSAAALLSSWRWFCIGSLWHFVAVCPPPQHLFLVLLCT